MTIEERIEKLEERIERLEQRYRGIIDDLNNLYDINAPLLYKDSKKYKNILLKSKIFQCLHLFGAFEMIAGLDERVIIWLLIFQGIYQIIRINILRHDSDLNRKMIDSILLEEIR